MLFLYTQLIFEKKIYAAFDVVGLIFLLYFWFYSNDDETSDDYLPNNQGPKGANTIANRSVLDVCLIWWIFSFWILRDFVKFQ